MGIFRAGRGGPTKKQYAARGLILVAGFCGLLGLLAMSLHGVFANTSPVQAQLDSAGGAIVSGSDVKVNGLVVGKVSSVSGDQGGVTLALSIDDEQIGTIPADVKARVLPASIFGTSYLDLVDKGRKAGKSTESLEAGDVIPQDLSQPTIELQQALDSVDTLVEALGPAKLASALNSVATTLDGQGAELGRTIDTLDRFLTKAEPQIPLVREDLRLLATNLQTIQAVAPDLLDATDDALYVTGHLVEKEAQFTALLAGGTNLVKDADSLVRSNGDNLVKVVREAAAVTQAVYDRRRGIPVGLLSISTVTKKLESVEGPHGLRVEGRLINPDRPGYTAADCPRYGSAAGSNCSAGRAPVSSLVGGALLREGAR